MDYVFNDSMESKYRVDLILVDTTTNAQLTGVQQKINQWITIGLLVRYNTTVVGDKILFEIVRIKQQGD
jgi:hypothetical protein